MIKAESDVVIIKNIFFKYIMQNPINRTLMLPVLITMAVAKYLEVLSASQTKQIVTMIKEESTSKFSLMVYFIICILGVALVEMQSFLICRAGQVGYRMSNKDTYKYFLELEPEEFNTIGKGEIITTISRKSQAVQDVIDVFTLNLFPTFLTVFFVSIEVFKNLGSVSVMIINISILIYGYTTIKITTWRNQMRKNLIIAQNKANNVLVDGLHNFETIFIHNTEDIEVDRYTSCLKNVEKHSTDISRSLYILNLAQRSIWCIMSIILIVLLVFGSKKVSEDQIIFLIYITGIIVKGLDNFGFMYGKLQAAIINARITNLEPRKKKHDGYRTLYKFSNQLAAKNLNIIYKDKTVLKNGSFVINKGEKIAIIGKNGSGKSTLIKSLVKLIKYNGVIELDGQNVENITDVSFKRLISYVPQNVVLFDDNVLRNIKYGNFKIFDEEIMKLCTDLEMNDSISKLANGFSTRVGEQGKNISGGERQKIAILRALSRETPIIIMDEATSNLDRVSEQILFSKLAMNNDVTLIAIIHNLELLTFFNRIFWINEGSINEVNPSDIDLKSWYSKE